MIQYLRFKHIDYKVEKESNGEVDDRAEEEEGKADPNSAKSDAPHVPKDQAVDIHKCILV